LQLGLGRKILQHAMRRAVLDFDILRHELRLPDGTWAACTLKQGEFVVNLGHMMARWTNERWTSNLHRVANPPLARAQSGRLSIGQFVHPNYDQAITCVPTCLAPGETPRYPLISAGEHIMRKIESCHEAAG